MSTLKVNRIEAYSGSSVEVIGLAATASNAIWSGISGIPSGLVSGSYSSSMSTRITAQEDFSSSLDATFATEAELDAATGSLVKSVSPSSTTAQITVTKGNGSSLTSTIFSSSFAIKAGSVRRSLSQGLGVESFSYDGGSIQSVQLNTSSAHFTTGAKSAAGSASFSTRISTLEDKTLVSSSISGDSQGQIKVNGVNVNVSSLQTTSNPTFANLTASNAIINNNLVVNGTASFARLESVTGSVKIIGDAFIQLNENTPSQRYAGLQVVDSGSTFSTASFFFDGLENNWMYEYEGDDTEYALALFGPEFGTKGSPVSLTENTVPLATGSHHLVDSNITDDGTTISLGSNSEVTGSLTVTAGVTASLQGSASFATTASFALNAAGGLTAQTASISTTMVKNTAYVVTGTAAPITMSLPASPTVGELIKFANMDDRATLLARNGNNIMGLAENMTLNVEQVSFDLVYVGPTAGWTIYGSRALS